MGKWTVIFACMESIATEYNLFLGSLIINEGLYQSLPDDLRQSVDKATYSGSPNHCKIFEPTEENIETVFDMAWDALRL